MQVFSVPIVSAGRASGRSYARVDGCLTRSTSGCSRPVSWRSRPGSILHRPAGSLPARGCARPRRGCLAWQQRSSGMWVLYVFLYLCGSRFSGWRGCTYLHTYIQRETQRWLLLRSTPSVPNYKSFQESWKVKAFSSLTKNIKRNIKIYVIK